jgi:hypothetical protein
MVLLFGSLYLSLRVLLKGAKIMGRLEIILWLMIMGQYIIAALSMRHKLLIEYCNKVKC